MRIKWSSLQSVMQDKPASPRAPAAVAEQFKKEPVKERELNKKDKKKKAEGPLDWLRRSR